MLLSFVLFYSFHTPSSSSAQNSSGAQKAPLTASGVIELLQKQYAQTNNYTADFVQTTAHKMFAGRLQRAYGKVMFKSGGTMRWEYERPEHKLFIYDGETLWIYEPEVPQVFAGSADAERLKRALAFLGGEGRILEEYSVKRLDADKFGFTDGHVLGLEPKDPRSPFSRVELYIDAITFRVSRSVVVDHDGNRNRLDFSNTRVDQDLSTDVFTFTPPPGVPVTRSDR